MKERPLTILMFSDIPVTEEATIREEISSILPNGGSIQLHLYPSIMEKWVVELSSRNGDIYIANEDVITKALVHEGLTPLDAIYQGKKIPEEAKRYQVTDKKTGDSHLYAVPIRKDLYSKNKWLADTQLPAILPQFSGNKKEALRVLKYLAEENQK